MTHEHFDAIIIGAGSIGLPLAWQLAEAGMRPLVLDRLPSAGQGSNKTAIGGIRATHSDPAKIRICLKSLDIFAGWQEQYGDDIGWLQGGYAFVAYRDREAQTLKALLQIQQAYGLDIDWYERRPFLNILPDLNPEGLLGGTFSPGDGSASPLLSALAFERRARECGAEFHYNESVTGIIRENGRISGVQTDTAQYHARWVVNAAGPWAREVGELAGVAVPLLPDCHEAGITEPVAPFLRPMVVDIRPGDGSANFYFYQHRTGQVIFCITPDPPIPGMDRRETSVFLPQVARRMVELMPCLAALRVRRTWRGLYPMTPDGMPIVGEVEGLAGFVNAAGMCGQGFMLGPGLAVYLRQYMTGGDDEETTAVLAQLSPQRSFKTEEKLK